MAPTGSINNDNEPAPPCIFCKKDIALLILKPPVCHQCTDRVADLMDELLRLRTEELNSKCVTSPEEASCDELPEEDCNPLTVEEFGRRWHDWLHSMPKILLPISIVFLVISLTTGNVWTWLLTMVLVLVSTVFALTRWMLFL